MLRNINLTRWNANRCYFLSATCIDWSTDYLITCYTALTKLCWDATNAQWDFQSQRKSGWTGKNSFVLEVSLRYLRPTLSIIYSVPCDRIVQSLLVVVVCVSQTSQSLTGLLAWSFHKYWSFMFLFRRGRQRTVKRLKTNDHSYCFAHWTFCLVSLPIFGCVLAECTTKSRQRVIAFIKIEDRFST